MGSTEPHLSLALLPHEAPRGHHIHLFLAVWSPAQWLSALSVNLFTTLQLVTLFTVFSSVASHLYPYLFSYELRSFYTAVYVFLPE